MSSKLSRFRGFISLILFFNFLVLLITGIVLYIVPPGRVAHWLDWQLLGLSKGDWQALHIVAGLIFVLMGIVHLIFNFKPFKHHLRTRLGSRPQLRLEPFLAAVFVAVLLGGTLAGWPPFKQLLALQENIGESWSRQASQEPPFSRAEEATLTLAASRMHRTPEALIIALERQGIPGLTPSMTVREIADAFGLSPAGVYQAMLDGLATDEPQGPAWLEQTQDQSIDQVRQRFADSGAGRKTVVQVAQENGIPLDVALARLAAAGFSEAHAESRLRAMGEPYGIGATDMIAIIVLPDYRPLDAR